MKIVTIFVLLMQIVYADDNYYYKNNQKVIITPKVPILRSSSNIDYYENDRGMVLGVTDSLIVKLKDNVDIQSYLSEFNLVVEEKLSKNLYLIKVKNKNLTIDISNRLSEKDGVVYAHPDFIKKRIKR